MIRAVHLSCTRVFRKRRYSGGEEPRGDWDFDFIPFCQSYKSRVRETMVSSLIAAVLRARHYKTVIIVFGRHVGEKFCSNVLTRVCYETTFSTGFPTPVSRPHTRTVSTVSKRISMPWQNPSVGTFYIIFQGIYYRCVLTSQITYIIIFFGVQSNGENANLSALSFNCRSRFETDSLCFSFVHF